MAVAVVVINTVTVLIMILKWDDVTENFFDEAAIRIRHPPAANFKEIMALKAAICGHNHACVVSIFHGKDSVLDSIKHSSE